MQLPRAAPQRMPAGTTPYKWEVAGSNPAGPTSWDRSSAVERQDVSAPLVAALAVQAQRAGHLTGSEAMEGANPSGGSVAVVVQQQNLGAPTRGSGCDSRPPLRSNAEGTPLVNRASESGFEARGRSARIASVSSLFVDHRHTRRMPVRTTSTLSKWCLRAHVFTTLVAASLAAF